MTINTIFTRKLLSNVHHDVRFAFPGIRPMRAAGVTGNRRTGWFVQINIEGYALFDDFYQAYDAYEARAKAWMAFIDKHAPKQIKRQLDAI